MKVNELPAHARPVDVSEASLRLECVLDLVQKRFIIRNTLPEMLRFRTNRECGVC